MNTSLKSKIQKLRADYNQVMGQPFSYFYCPILGKDEDVELCKAHIINEVFPGSARNWTVQRKDVDNFYGSLLESEFVAIQNYRNRSLGVGDIITDKTLSKKLSPKLYADDLPVDYFIAQNRIPESYTRMDFENRSQVVKLGLKIPPEEVLDAM